MLVKSCRKRMAKRKMEALYSEKQGGYHEGQREWSDEDTILLTRLHACNGNAWKLIASHFPDRTCSSIRNRFYRLQKNIEKNQRSGETGNKCAKCGMRRRGHLCSLGVNLGEDTLLDRFSLPDTLLVDYSKLECDSSTFVVAPIQFVWSPEDSASLKC